MLSPASYKYSLTPLRPSRPRRPSRPSSLARSPPPRPAPARAAPLRAPRSLPRGGAQPDLLGAVAGRDPTGRCGGAAGGARLHRGPVAGLLPRRWSTSWKTNPRRRDRSRVGNVEGPAEDPKPESEERVLKQENLDRVGRL